MRAYSILQTCSDRCLRSNSKRYSVSCCIGLGKGCRTRTLHTAIRLTGEMVVLAASICTKAGKPVISRQFREMPKSRIEGLLTSFPKLIPANSQHTSVETSEVRYVYQPLEDLYILLITNKASNILQDIDTLHLFARVVSDLCRSTPDEREIFKNAFELLGAFDEIVSLGFREPVNLMQIRSVLEMESHEEKIQDIIARNKEAEAKEELKRRAKQLEMQRRDQARRTQGGGGSSNIGGGISGYSSIPRFEAPAQEIRSSSPASAPLKAPAFKGTGMKLGKKNKQSDLIDALGGELVTPSGSIPSTPARASSPQPAKYTPAVDQESIHVAIREQLSLTLNQSGGLKSLALKGDLNLLITDATYTKIRLGLASHSQEDYGADLQFKYHPNLFKGSEAERGALEAEVKLKDAGRSWPVGQPLGVLRWKLATKDESLVPLSINCWPSPTGDGTIEVNIEYELESDRLTLHGLTITIPLPGGFPSVTSHSGTYAVDPSTNALVWSIPLVSPTENRSGSLEFTVDGDDASVFFPVKVDFAAEGSLVGVKVANVYKVDSEDEAVFSQEATCTTEEYLIV